MLKWKRNANKQVEVEKEIIRRTRFRFFGQNEPHDVPAPKSSKKKRVNIDLSSQISTISDSQIFNGSRRKFTNSVSKEKSPM